MSHQEQMIQKYGRLTLISFSLLLFSTVAVIPAVSSAAEIYWGIDDDHEMWIDNTELDPLKKTQLNGTGKWPNGDGNTAINMTMKNVTYVHIMNETAMNDCSNLFADFNELRAVYGMDKLDTSNAVRFNNMFLRCYNLTEVDVSRLNTSNATTMQSMFSSCYSLTEADVSGFNTSKVTRMDNMFNDCYNLTKADVSGFDTESVILMNHMFSRCYNLTEADVSGFNTSKVTTTNSMFNHCLALKTLNVSRFDTSNVMNMSQMFMACPDLTSLDTGSFTVTDSTNVTNMFSFGSDDTTSKISMITVSGSLNDVLTITNLPMPDSFNNKWYILNPNDVPVAGYNVNGYDNVSDMADLTLSGDRITYATGHTIRADADARGIISPSGNVSVETGGKITFRMMPYTGWHISDVIVDGVSVGAVSSYTFEDVDADHTISARYEADDTSTTVPKTIENLEKLIDHMVNNTPLDGNYDFNQDFRVNGKDVILLEMMIA